MLKYVRLPRWPSPERALSAVVKRMYYFYVLNSQKDGRNYYGVTDNIGRRFKEHNDGKNKSTRFRRPFVLLYTREFTDKSAAYKYEWQVKHNGDTNKQLKVILAEMAEIVKARV